MASFVGEIEHRKVFRLTAVNAVTVWLSAHLVVTADAREQAGPPG